MPVNHYIVTTSAFKANTKLNTEYTFKNTHLLFQETLMFRLQGNGRSFLIISYRNRVPREAVAAPGSLEVSEAGLDGAVSNLLWVPTAGGWDEGMFSSQIPRDILESTARAPSGGEARPGSHRNTFSVRL